MSISPDLVRGQSRIVHSRKSVSSLLCQVVRPEVLVSTHTIIMLVIWVKSDKLTALFVV